MHGNVLSNDSMADLNKVLIQVATAEVELELI